MKYTIKDIAKLCGVGKSTVSRVINNDPNVKDDTRARVQAVINEVGFQPNRSARAMRGISELVVGIIVTRLNSPSESQTLSAILQELYPKEITPLIVESQFQPELVERHLEIFKQRQVDGVIIFGFSELTSQILQKWQASIVTLVGQYPNIPSVSYDDENAVQCLLTHFYEQGHHHIAYLGVTDDDQTTGKLRNQSYRQFCEQYQLTPNLVLGDLSMENAYRNMADLFAQPVDAIVCASSSLAIGALKFLQKTGQNRPLACIGCNHLVQYLVPEMLCLDFGYHQAGKWAVEMLLNQLNGNKMLERRCVPFKLIE